MLYSWERFIAMKSMGDTCGGKKREYVITIFFFLFWLKIHISLYGCIAIGRETIHPPSAKLEPLTEVHLVHTLQTTAAVDLFYICTASGSLKLMSTGINKLQMELNKQQCLLHSYHEQTLLKEGQN